MSLEQDVELVGRTLPGPGVVLFAGGSDSPTVRELAPIGDGDTLRTALGDLFAPRASRASRYRTPRLSAQPATQSNVEGALSAALSTPPSGASVPLLVYLAGHGDRGSAPAQNSLALWGGGALSVERLAALHEKHARPLRLVATSCFSGGFGELAFAAADAKLARPAPVLRCGVFAGTDDRETSGCDPNPRRRAQESYGLHLTHAISGLRKDGSKLAPTALDFDGNGKVGLLDAHTWARIEAASFDVPTTTSERWLRAVEPGSAAIRPALLPEDAAVVTKLGQALGTPTEAAAHAEWRRIDQRIEDVNVRLDAAEDALHAIEDSLATSLLERWPVLDDAYHALFEATLTQHRAAISQALLESDAARERLDARRATDELYAELDHHVVAEARVLRVLRAYETLHKVAALQRRGGRAKTYYDELLACERATIR